MRALFFAVPALIVAGAATAQGADRRDALDARASTPRIEYRSAFDGYRPFAERDLRDWRTANEEVREAGGPHKPGRGSGQQTSKPQPGSPGASGHHGHGADK